MQDLPLNGRNPLQLTTLTPGTVITDVGTEATQQDNRGITVNGLRATQNNFQLDGTIYTNRFFDSVPIMPDPGCARGVHHSVLELQCGAWRGGRPGSAFDPQRRQPVARFRIRVLAQY